jgi:hypothetical protein
MNCLALLLCFGTSLLMAAHESRALFDDGGEYTYLQGNPFTTVYDNRQHAGPLNDLIVDQEI